ncbi:GMC family oxidoreductase N-terminal domain-containing protein [Rhizobium sp. RHZ01]|uniref:GMC family oxidoreductase n=1 Tax=Rhizobium sp. RHZ01 TaxID=2769304 RepID=UPI001781B0E8|nr:GMC family oxidoreductase N-terminal domain-containing protein [Rhizobium sp. RHZ01]MBD9448495.1 GMC family oxidoreductase N-terminal domain-containing protein [Rhizobium sp. RHZ01]
MINSFDYVIVGGGSAGCVLAARLSEDPAARVCLIEAGDRDKNPLIHMPVGFAKMTTGPLTWGLETVPQKYAMNRVIPYAQAKVLGGGSSINAEVYTRGHPSDYDRWEQEGAEGWGFKEVQKYFLRAEGNTVYSGALHGTEGPLGVSNIPDPNPLTKAFAKSCQEYGIPYNPDFNGERQEGAGIYQLTTRNNRRCSAAVGYLKPVLGRPNLTLVTGALVLRVVFEGARAVGIDYVVGGKKLHAGAATEVVVTAGAIGTPKLLMHSGVGPAAHLRSLGIPIIQDLGGVGQNLTDHYGVDIVAEIRNRESLDKYNELRWMLWAGLQYALFNSGPVTSNVVEGGAFWYGDKSETRPDLQFHFLAGAGAEAGVPSVPKGTSGVTLNSYTLRPKSRGTVTLRSSDPRDLPLVDPNFLSDPDDLRISVEGVKISCEIMRQASLQKYVKTIHFPDPNVRTQADFEDYARKFGRTSYHPTCTCRMGTDEMSVVDPKLRIHGLEGIRICDSSVMPSLVGSNTNAPTIMIAERASDFIKGNR